MVKDRLAEIPMVHQTRGRGRSADSDDECDSEKDKLLSPENWSTVDKYLELSMRIAADMELLDKDIQEISTLHARLLSQPATPALTQELNRKTDAVHSKMRGFKKEVMDLNKGLESSTDQTATVNNRIIKEQVTRLTRNLLSLGTKFEKEQMEYKEKSKKNYTTYLKVLNTELADEALEEALEDGTLSSKINGVILALDQKKDLLDEVKQRTDDILTLEQSIRGLSEMFHDLHLLVCSQDEMLNNIEMNIGRSVEYAVKAKDDIVAAQKMKRRAQMMKIGIIIGVILLVIIIFMVGKMLFCFYLPFLCG
ncbi:hypothetical protein PENTCL1PPCAC_28872 [Pristionchus entomophagus]|uniref:t-SNARE coiled-coil homology domain-containing protein n=1 Tax=Pristionchus entomophagus TaxID=358040 RepID=A0AAV5UK72_9BILA|nr:hypothetical protein PENTCL1PPCAC_28872 [Pristionchus entomophagus]